MALYYPLLKCVPGTGTAVPAAEQNSALKHRGAGLTAPRQTWEWLYNSRTPLIQMEEQTI
ncbi:hypothetical protein [Hornefia butyriciproducens]|uniref:Uncharacterized protein n=1 Tax=Hornefia butyriciproducens TaxID=2652293 RepID=A0A6L5Y4Y6_9FIRM|nr:hypothetical protein [Hornefia butyriciproducens]MST51740.1 hypothetical protein [Hornefia butyriciproducens]